MKILNFITEEETFSKLQELNEEEVVIDLGNIYTYPLITSYILKLFRYSKIKGIRLIFLTPDAHKGVFKEIRKFVEIYTSIEEYENVKIYTNYEIKIYENNLYLRKLMKDLLIENGFNIKERNLINFLNKDHDCKYNSFYIIDYSNYKDNIIKEINKIKIKNSESIIVLLSEEKDLEEAVSNMNEGIDYVILKPFQKDEFIKTIKKLTLESYYKRENKILLDKVIKNERKITRLYNQIDEELKLASFIQQSFLPKEEQIIENYSVNYKYKPSLKIGGDFYENIKLNEDEIFIAFADLSGHGIPAALLSSMVKMSIQNKIYLLNSGNNKNRLINFLEILNEDFIKVFPKGKFVSMFCSILNIKENKLIYSKASQEPALLIRDNKIEKLETEGILLGMFSKKIFPTAVIFEEKEIKLKKEDKIVFYTDGITEAEKNGVYFENEFFNILKNKNTDNKSIIDNIITKLNEFSDNILDDISLLVISRNY